MGRKSAVRWLDKPIYAYFSLNATLVNGVYRVHTWTLYHVCRKSLINWLEKRIETRFSSFVTLVSVALRCGLGTHLVYHTHPFCARGFHAKTQTGSENDTF